MGWSSGGSYCDDGRDFHGHLFHLSFWYKLNKETWWGAIFSGIGCAALLAINFLFVPKFGYMACAWGGFAGYGICMVLSYLVGQKRNPVPYQLKVVFGYFMLAGVVYALVRVTSHLMGLGYLPDRTWLRLVLNTLFLLVYVGVLLYLERALVRKVWDAAKGMLLHRK